MHNRNRLATAIAVASAMGSLVSMPSFGQAEEESIVEEVIVTGSRIARANLTAPTPVTTLSEEDIRFTGQTNSADILRTLPSVGISAISSTNSNFSTSGGGVNTINLRNLGEDRTLVLVNGRRYVSGLAGSSAVDFNTIPTELIDRIEVITGGASAIYGSDALAGVINVILKDDYEGVDMSYQYGEHMDEGDDQEHRLNFTMGGNFSEGKGNAVMSATYTRNDGVYGRDRDGGAVDSLALCYITGEPSDCDELYTPFYSSFSERGRFFVPSTGRSFSITDDGSVAPWSTTSFGFNRQAERLLSTPTERFLFSANGKYDVGNSVEAFVETMFASTETDTDLEPFPHSNSDLNIPGIPVDNPYVPQDIRDAVLNAGDSYVEYFRRMTEVGNRGYEAERTTYRMLFGFRGEFMQDYNWETYYAYGRMSDDQRGGGQLNAPNMRAALDAIDGDGDPNTFDPICASPAARAEGCVPINLFGLGSISPEAADWVRAPTQRQQDTKQQIAGFNLTGPLFELPAGDLQFAIGAEYRREYAKDTPDALTQSGQNAGNKEGITKGDYDVGEIYGEIEIPILKDAPLAKELSVGGAYRYSDYSTIGSTDAYTFRASWSPIEELRVRAQYARAVRAPNIGELYAPGGENFASVADPCNGVTATTTGNVAENCRSLPEVAARIAETGVFSLTQTEIQGTGGFTGAGNGDLDTETADSYTLGFVFDQDFGRVGDLSISVDWFDIEIEDLISTIGRQTSIDFCYNATPSDFPNKFCSAIVRDTSGPAFQLGEITEVNSGFINEGTLETSGFDTQVNWTWNFADWVSFVPGQGGINLNWTRTDDYTLTQFGVEYDLVGELYYPEDKVLATFSYTLDRFTAQWQTTYMSDMRPSNSDEFFSVDLGEYWLNDFYAQFQATDNFNIYAGIDNVLDKDPPLVPSGVPGNVTGSVTAADVYDALGRTWYAGVRLSF